MASLNERELELASIAVYYCREYDNSNPDIGMAPFTCTIIDRVASRLSFDLDPEDYDRIEHLLRTI